MLGDFLKGAREAALRVVGPLLDRYVPPAVREALSRGEFWVPQELLAAGLEDALGEDTPLRRLECSPSGCRLVVGVARLGVALDATVRLTVEGLLVRADRQELTFRVGDLGLTGTNWAGKLVAPLAAAILRRVYGGRLVALAGSAGLEVRRHPDAPNRFTADLANLPQVQKLRGVSLLNWTLLDLVRVTGCHHAEGGLYLQGEVGLPSQSPKSAES